MMPANPPRWNYLSLPHLPSETGFVRRASCIAGFKIPRKMNKMHDIPPAVPLQLAPEAGAR
jgi:hypothetical protein